MIYVINTTVPANTPINTPVRVEQSVSGKYVTHAQVQFPLNAAGLAGVRLLDRASTFAPAPGSTVQWFTGDGSTVEWDDDQSLEGTGSWVVAAEFYNLDTTFTRTIEVRFTIEAYPLRRLLQDVLSKLAKVGKNA